MECFKNWDKIFSANNKRFFRKCIKLRKFLPKKEEYYNLFKQE